MGSRLVGSRRSLLEKGLAEPAAEAKRRADSRTAVLSYSYLDVAPNPIQGTFPKRSSENLQKL